MYRSIRPLLFVLSPEVAHAITLQALNVAHRFDLLPVVAPSQSAPIQLLGLNFPNRLGVAAGLDKSGTCIDALGALGFGCVEVGTVTPRPQSGNARPRLFRLIQDQALINRMGFPNDGVQLLCERLRSRRFLGVCGVSIGKNAMTPLSDAASDYAACLMAVYPYADYIAINISSPNTTELRRLQHGELLQSLLTTLMEARAALVREHGRHVPMLVKLSADLSDAELANAARVSIASGIDGVITTNTRATNTTVHRDRLCDSKRMAEGGLSGVPLLSHALNAVQCIRAEVGATFPIIGVGGIASATDAVAMRVAGADLFQVYTGLIYRGPALIAEILKSNASA